MALFRQLIRQSHHRHLIVQVGKQIKASRLAARAPARTGQGEWGMEVLEHVGDGVGGSAKTERLGYFQLAQNYAKI